MRLLRSTATVGGATILSRILGFLRDVVFARLFGASGETDAFFLAFKIPNFMRRLFAEGSFSLAFVPVLSEVRATGDEVTHNWYAVSFQESFLADPFFVAHALREAFGDELARYYVDNLFEALTEPGEWYLDRHRGKLFYIPLPGETPR